MKIARFLFLLSSLAATFSCTRNDNVNMFVGTYSGDSINGIYVYGFNQRTGRLTKAEVSKQELRNASYLTANPSFTNIYAVSEMPDSSASVSAFGFDPVSRKFTPKGSALTLGEDPCYVSTNGRFLVTANYTGGSLSVFRLSANGELLDSKPFQKFAGSAGGPDSLRQDSPHMHCAVFTPDSSYLLVSDFSSDRILSYKVGSDSLEYYGASSLESGFGPRHIIFGSDSVAYVIGELAGDITVMKYKDGLVSPFEVIGCDPNHAGGSADIRLSPDGKFLYASNRLKNDGVAVFSVESDGYLNNVSYTQTGIHPRNIALTPNGKYLLVACRDDNRIEVYKRNRRNGKLTKTETVVEIEKPVCIMFD